MFFALGLLLKGGLNMPMNFSFCNEEYTMLGDIPILSLF
jgi:hypothetical protein